MQKKYLKTFLLSSIVLTNLWIGHTIKAEETSSPLFSKQVLKTSDDKTNSEKSASLVTSDLTAHSDETQMSKENPAESVDESSSTSLSMPVSKNKNDASNISNELENAEKETSSQASVTSSLPKQNSEAKSEVESLETNDKRNETTQNEELPTEVETQAIFRLYNPNSGEHHYTAQVGESNFLVSVGWLSEGIGWYAPRKGDAVFRLYNPNNGDHHYTRSKDESDHLNAVGWNYEGIGWYSGGDKAVYRLYNPNAKGPGSHHYTLSESESHYLDSVGWNDEGIGWFSVSVTDSEQITENKKASASQGNYQTFNKVIYLDAGHGGSDPGAVYNHQTEKYLNLTMQNIVKAKLEEAGYTVILSRSADESVSLMDRSAKANKSLSDMFVSIHFNASTNHSAHGIETYYYKYYEEYPSKINAQYHNNSERLSRSLFLAEALQSEVVLKTGAKNNGVLRNTFAVLRETTAPAVLLELGYMSNSSEFQKINSDTYQKSLAEGIVSGILSYYRHYFL